MTAVSDNGTRPSTSQSQLIALMALADEAPTGAELARFLTDPDPVVRRTALEVLTESAPDDAGVPLARLMVDPDAKVRAAAIAGMRELREVLVVDDSLAASLLEAWESDDPSVRATVVQVWREQRIGEITVFVAASQDPDTNVRREAVAGLVSLDALDELAALVGDTDATMRLAVARAITTTASTVDRTDARVAASLATLADDADVRVRAAAVEGLGTVDLDDRTGPALTAALSDADWQVRRAAALAVASAPEEIALPALIDGANDSNIDVRKAAVQSLVRWVDRDPAARRALELAIDDPDADVRGYARLGLG